MSSRDPFDQHRRRERLRQMSSSLGIYILCLLLFSIGTTQALLDIKDHFHFSQVLTSENFEEVVQSEIDSGRTMFVRFIANDD